MTRVQTPFNGTAVKHARTFTHIEPQGHADAKETWWDKRRDSKVPMSWDEFAAPGAPKLDYIFTVCASAAGETCPIWPGHPTTAHWGIDDPAHVEPLEARQAAFEVAYAALEKRIKAFLALDLESMSRQDIVAAARLIHEAAK